MSSSRNRLGRLEALVQSLTDGLVLEGPTGTCCTPTAAPPSLTGLSLEELQGRGRPRTSDRG